MGGVPNRAWLRIILFLGLLGGVVWYFNGRTETGSAAVLPKEVNDKINILGEQVDKVIPAETRKKMTETVDEKVVKRSREVIEKTKIIKEVEKSVEKAADEISGFPKKQEKEVKRQLIEGVCEKLLKDLEDNE